jgi:NAD(P)-dependent dehydrogenase (short-subunit alcohol dehydrogenase family)
MHPSDCVGAEPGWDPGHRVGPAYLVPPVRRLHAAGARVVVADVADEKGKALEQELGVRYVHVDAGSEAHVLAAIAEAEAMGALRISVDVHGGPAAGGRLLGKDGSPMGLDGFRTTIQSYLSLGRSLTRTAGGGIIINTASIAAYEGQIGQLAYAAAKGGSCR